MTGFLLVWAAHLLRQVGRFFCCFFAPDFAPADVQICPVLYNFGVKLMPNLEHKKARKPLILLDFRVCVR